MTDYIYNSKISKHNIKMLGLVQEAEIADCKTFREFLKESGYYTGYTDEYYNGDIHEFMENSEGDIWESAIANMENSESTLCANSLIKLCNLH